MMFQFTSFRNAIGCTSAMRYTYVGIVHFLSLIKSVLLYEMDKYIAAHDIAAFFNTSDSKDTIHSPCTNDWSLHRTKCYITLLKTHRRGLQVDIALRAVIAKVEIR